MKRFLIIAVVFCLLFHHHHRKACACGFASCGAPVASFSYGSSFNSFAAVDPCQAAPSFAFAAPSYQSFAVAQPFYGYAQPAFAFNTGFRHFGFHNHVGNAVQVNVGGGVGVHVHHGFFGTNVHVH